LHGKTVQAALAQKVFVLQYAAMLPETPLHSSVQSSLRLHTTVCGPAHKCTLQFLAMALNDAPSASTSSFIAKQCRRHMLEKKKFFSSSKSSKYQEKEKLPLTLCANVTHRDPAEHSTPSAILTQAACNRITNTFTLQHVFVPLAGSN
jgi:hypothetical protein